jgi:hypothetical protein
MYETTSRAIVLSVACPGGIARQFRVQVQDAETPLTWQMVGSFADRPAAKACAEQWGESGRLARVVECRCLPTAA